MNKDIKEYVMSVAFVLINAEIGSENEILEGLSKVKNVIEAHMVYGVYDIVAKVEAETMEKLKETIKKTCQLWRKADCKN